MAVAKKGPATGRVNKWDAEFAKFAGTARAAADTAASGGNFIRVVNNANLSYKGAVIGSSMEGIIIDSCFMNAYYAERYDPNNPSPPDCYAFNREDQNNMIPSEKIEVPQHHECRTCPMNAWGSADTGRGKACKNRRRLAIMLPDALEEGIEAATIAYFELPPTSGGLWDGYVKLLDDVHKRPPFGVLTKIKVVPDKDYQFRIEFEFVELLDGQHAPDLIAKHQRENELIMFDFQPKEEAAEEKPKGKAKPKGADKFAGRGRQ